MKRHFAIIIALILFLTLPAMAAAFGSFGTKSLCEFPFGPYGGVNIHYDQRLYHPYYFEGSYPNGGIKFTLFLSGFTSDEALDALIKQIYWIRYTNKSNGSTYLLTKPYIGLWDGDTVVEYNIWLGASSLVIGNWQMVILTKFGRYTATFEITQEMMDQIPAIAVDPYIYFYDGDPGIIEITALYTNGDDYRFRIFDSDGNFIGPDVRWRPDPIECSMPGSTCQYTVSYLANGDLFRIETRKRYQDWLQLYPGPDCNSDGMSPGAVSRSLIWLKLAAPPTPEPECPANCIPGMCPRDPLCPPECPPECPGLPPTPGPECPANCLPGMCPRDPSCPLGCPPECPGLPPAPP